MSRAFMARKAKGDGASPAGSSLRKRPAYGTSLDEANDGWREPVDDTNLDDDEQEANEATPTGTASTGEAAAKRFYHRDSSSSTTEATTEATRKQEDLEHATSVSEPAIEADLDPILKAHKETKQELEDMKLRTIFSLVDTVNVRTAHSLPSSREALLLPILQYLTIACPINQLDLAGVPNGCPNAKLLFLSNSQATKLELGNVDSFLTGFGVRSSPPARASLGGPAEHIHPAMLAGIRTCYGRPATEPRAMHGDATPLPCLRTSHHRPLRPQPVHVSDLAEAKARDQLVPIVRQLLWESQRLWAFLSLVSATLQRQN